MHIFRKKLMWIFLAQVLCVTLVFAQGKLYEGPDDPAGDIEAEREGYMSGNRILLYFQNTTELAKWTETYVGSQWSRWPNTEIGVRMLDGIGLLIGAQVFLENNTIPVTDPYIIASRSDLDTLWFLQTSYREEMDTNPIGTVEWGIYPVYGYLNPNSEHPAMSNDSLSWPVGGWPSTGYSLKWPGEWNGRFGRGVIYADLETYFVANDAQDQEFLGPEDRVKYYPRPGRYIGDLRPEVTIQPGLPWGGIGIRVEQRGFQWNNPQARDAIFWEYSIANISEYDLPEVAFGYWVDNGIGGEADDEIGFFDRQVDLAYSWDTDETGRAGLRTGTMGFAYLESPGIPYDNQDNDEDGIIDEKRDNDAGDWVGPYDGIYDLQKFLEVYRLDEEDLVEHYEGDEDQDWQPGLDLNGNGVYAIEVSPGIWALEEGEDPGDDVGLDGVHPLELNYRGPDEGEGNNRPDYRQGVGCEPNFNATDVTESDMVGLTSFRLFPIPQHRPPWTRWFRNDKSMWDLIGQDSTLEYLGSISNLVECFASGPFPLYQGREERISMSELHSYDPLTGLETGEHSAPALYEAKRIVQVIYEKDYRFAQPPKMPTLSATPADGKIILTWDNAADTKTRDPFMGNINDFEGYKVFRSTDKRWSDSYQITDGFGEPFLQRPIFQCDLKDDIKGFSDYGIIKGVGFNLGYDTGVVHHFIDNTVQNGRTYYYAIVAYDYGAPDIGPGIAPSENNAVIKLDEAENILATGKNVAIAIPHQQAAGYEPPNIERDTSDVLGSGTVDVEILASHSLNPDHTYKIAFGVDTLTKISNYDKGYLFVNNSLHVYDQDRDNLLIYQETPDNFPYENLVYDDTLKYWSFKTDAPFSTDVFDGIRLNITMPVRTARYDYRNSDWKGDRESPITIIPSTAEGIYFPWDYDIVFTDNDSAYVGRVTLKFMNDEYGSRINSSELLVTQSFNFYVVNTSFVDGSGSFEKMDLVVHDKNKNGKLDIDDRVLVGPVNSKGIWAGTIFVIEFGSVPDSLQLPQAGDVFHVTHERPFLSTDSIRISIQEAAELNKVELKSTMDKIKVVPNPYIATNAMEESVGSNPYLNQRRKIMFTHIPAKCTIKIFTSSGQLVDEVIVNNASDNGIAHWDMLTSEGLEIAAGIYIYHIKSDITGDEKLGKFAVVK
jgi:hypothetical protein